MGEIFRVSHPGKKEAMRIMLEGLRGSDSIAELWRKEGPMLFGHRACITHSPSNSWRLESAGLLVTLRVQRQAIR